jgi:ubiquinone/menaquinone biosynthesis C-methylase UbiE
MKSVDREDGLYAQGKRCAIEFEEEFILNSIKKNKQKNTDLLDLGCGSGEITQKYKELGFNTSGVDFSEVAVKIACEKGLACKVADLDERIPFDDHSYDVVTASDVLEHVFDPIHVLSEVNRVLKIEGTFYATIPYDLNIKIRLRTLMGQSYQENVYKKFGQFKHHSFFSERLMRYMYEKSGLKIKYVYYLINSKLLGKKFIVKSPIFRIFCTLMIVRAEKSV